MTNTLIFEPGVDWGWMVGAAQELNQDVSRPFICEIPKVEIYKITQGEKDFGKKVCQMSTAKDFVRLIQLNTFYSNVYVFLNQHYALSECEKLH